MEAKIIVYVDESGDAGRARINDPYPVFVLACCIFEVDYYIHTLVPAFQRLKFNWFGHDQVVFHSNDIRRRKGDFSFLKDDEANSRFQQELTTFVRDAEFQIIAEVVHKRNGIDAAGATLYDESVLSSLKRLRGLRGEVANGNKDPSLVFESRGLGPDNQLRKAINNFGWNGPIWFSSKLALSTGLQIADLVARPIGLYALHDDKKNSPFHEIKDKLV